MKKKTEHDRVIFDKEKMVLENFVNIASFCPDVILSDAAKRRDLDQLLCDDPRANEFIKLDYKIYIDKDDKDIKKFEDAIFDWVTSLCDLIKAMHNDLNFTVIPAGSFPLNVKVGNLDEFDYVLSWENKAEIAKIQEISGKGHMLLPRLRQAILYVINVVLVKSEKKLNLSDIQFMRKAHAINIQFSSMCSSSHKHSVSIDLAILVRTSTTIQEYFSQIDFPLKGTPFEDSVDINEKMYWNCALDIGFDRPDTNIFDKPMLETCDRISPNIRLCYRVLKFIRDYFFPCFAKKGFNLFTYCHVKYLKATCSSYLLKQVLFHEVIEFPSSDHWNNSFIHLRIASMQQRISKDYPNLFDDNKHGSRFMYQTDAFSPVKTNIMLWLYNGCETISLQRRSMLNEWGECTYVLLENKILVTLPKFSFIELEICIHPSFEIIMFKSFRPLLLHNKISIGLSEAFLDIVESMDHVDLTSFSDADVGEILILLRLFVVTRKEICCSNYLNKLNNFQKMLYMYEKSCFVAFNQLLELECAYSVNSRDIPLYKTMKEKIPSAFITLEVIFTSITWEERSFISKYLYQSEPGAYREKGSKTMIQSLDKVIDAFKKSFVHGSRIQAHLWLLVSISTLRNLK